MTSFVGVIVGSAGSGKSTIARQLARESRAALLDKDSMSSDLLASAMAQQGHRTDDRESSSFYRERLMPLEYRALFRVCADNLANDVPVIIDAPFAAYLDQTDYFRDAADAYGWPEVPILVGHVTASAETVRSRLLARDNPRDEWKLANWDQFWHQLGQLEPLWTGVSTVKIRNDEAPDLTHWRQVLEHLTRGSKGDLIQSSPQFGGQEMQAEQSNV